MQDASACPMTLAPTLIILTHHFKYLSVHFTLGERCQCQSWNLWWWWHLHLHVPPKSLGIGGKTLLLVGECGRKLCGSSMCDATIVTVPFSSGCRDPSARIVCAVEDTLKNDDEPLLGVALNAVPTEGRFGSSFSGVISSGSFSLTLSRSRDLTPKESFEAFFTNERGFFPVSFEPDDPRRRWLLGRDCALSGTEEMSMDGM